MSQEIEAEVVSVIELFRGRLGEEWVEDYVALARHNECVVALENLCVQLYEFDIVPTEEEYQAIRDAAQRLEVDPDSWTYLKSG